MARKPSILTHWLTYGAVTVMLLLIGIIVFITRSSPDTEVIKTNAEVIKTNAQSARFCIIGHATTLHDAAETSELIHELNKYFRFAKFIGNGRGPGAWESSIVFTYGKNAPETLVDFWLKDFAGGYGYIECDSKLYELDQKNVDKLSSFLIEFQNKHGQKVEQ